MKKLIALILAIMMMATLLVSCSNDGKTVVVGYTIYAPMNYMDEDGELIGYDTDLAKAVFEKLGYTVIFKEIVWGNKYTELDAGTIDCIWNGFTANTSDDDGIARADKVDFSYNYMLNKQVVVTTSDSTANAIDFDSFSGKVGAAETGSAGYGYLDSFAGCTKKGLDSQLDALKELKLGTADFAVLDEQLADAYVGKGDYAGLIKVDALSSAEEFYAIGFKKGSELTAKVNEALEQLAADGTIATIAEKYGVSVTAIKDFADQK